MQHQVAGGRGREFFAICRDLGEVNWLGQLERARWKLADLHHSVAEATVALALVTRKGVHVDGEISDRGCRTSDRQTSRDCIGLSNCLCVQAVEHLFDAVAQIGSSRDVPGSVGTCRGR